MLLQIAISLQILKNTLKKVGKYSSKGELRQRYPAHQMRNVAPGHMNGKRKRLQNDEKSRAQNLNRIVHQLAKTLA